MKQKIFNRGNGWYISGSNYKNKEDKAYISLFFPRESDPEYHETENGFMAKDIDILEAKFTSYNGKPGMTIFKYVEIKSESEPKQTITRKQDYTGGGYEEIKSEDLPFY